MAFSCLISRRTLQLSRCSVLAHEANRSSYTAKPATHTPKASSSGGAEWSGLGIWRAGDIDNRHVWGKDRPVEGQVGEEEGLELPPMPSTLAACGIQVLTTADPYMKSALSHRAWSAFKAGRLPIGSPDAPLPSRPARPAKPELVHPKLVPTPKSSPLPPGATTLHNLAHIELNAIDLAWDTLVRFAPLQLPHSFYADFAHVADDESRHLGWCLQRLKELGHSYGDMPAHDLLWQGAAMSSGDVMARLAVVPMSQEARGLDAGNRLAQRLVGWGDNRSAGIVARIAEEEMAHVAVGVSWMLRVSAALGWDPAVTFRGWLLELCPDLLKGPFNHEARQEAGLVREWYDPVLWSAQYQARLPPDFEAGVNRTKKAGAGRRGNKRDGSEQQAAASAAGGLRMAGPLASVSSQSMEGGAAGGVSSLPRASAGAGRGSASSGVGGDVPAQVKASRSSSCSSNSFSGGVGQADKLDPCANTDSLALGAVEGVMNGTAATINSGAHNPSSSTGRSTVCSPTNSMHVDAQQGAVSGGVRMPGVAPGDATELCVLGGDELSLTYKQLVQLRQRLTVMLEVDSALEVDSPAVFGDVDRTTMLTKHL